MIVQASGNRLTTFEAYERMGLGRDHRTYEEVAALRALLGVTAPLEVLTNNPDKLAALAAEGIPIAGTVPLRHAPSPFNLHYLAAKLDSGHALDAEGGAARAAELPEPVTYFEPYALDGAPHLIHVASYLVPLVRRPATGNGAPPCWFWLHAYFDTEAGRERVVLAYRRTPDVVPLVRLQPEALFDRFPLRAGGPHRRSWNAAVRTIARHGAGAVAFATEDGGPDEATIRLLARHATKRVRPLVDAQAVPELAAMLGRYGVTVDPPAVLSNP
jgi:GTP cyclohydrolase II